MFGHFFHFALEFGELVFVPETGKFFVGIGLWSFLWCHDNLMDFQLLASASKHFRTNGIPWAISRNRAA